MSHYSFSATTTLAASGICGNFRLVLERILKSLQK